MDSDREIMLKLKYSELVPGWPIRTRVSIYGDEQRNLWELLYSVNDISKFKGILGAFSYALIRPSPQTIIGKVKSKDECRLVLETEDDEYTFDHFNEKELENMERTRKYFLEAETLSWR